MSDTPQPERFRLDKWLWVARFAPSRADAQQACAKGHIRHNGERVTKASRQIRPGDMLTVPQGQNILVLKVISDSKRRGPATEARKLYEILEE